jgi:hypothetical protein
MQPEYVYLGHNNTVDLRLKADNQDGLGSVAINLENVTKITLSFNGTLVVSTEKASGLITWDQVGYDTGEIRIAIGGEALTAGTFRVPLVVYDASTPTGIVWEEEVLFIVVAEVEASP